MIRSNLREQWYGRFIRSKPGNNPGGREMTPTCLGVDSLYESSRKGCRPSMQEVQSSNPCLNVMAGGLEVQACGAIRMAQVKVAAKQPWPPELSPCNSQRKETIKPETLSSGFHVSAGADTPPKHTTYI